MGTAYPWDDIGSVQREFFRVGVYTYLFISYENNILDWQFTFRDLGMDHSIRDRCLVVPAHWIGEDRWIVQTSASPPIVMEGLSTDAMMLLVFEGHYQRAVLDMNEQFQILQTGLLRGDLGIQQRPPTGPAEQIPDTCAALGVAQSRIARGGSRALSSPPRAQ